MSDDEHTVHATMAQGAELWRYSDGQWWIVYPGKSMAPGRRVSVKAAAIRAVADGTPILGVPGGRTFDRLVARELAMTDEERMGLSSPD